MKKLLWAILAAAGMFSSCVNEMEIVPQAPVYPAVLFSETVGEYGETRAMTGHPIENDHSDAKLPNAGLIPVGRSFGAYAWAHGGDEEAPAPYEPLTGLPGSDKEVTRGADVESKAVYSYGDPVPWPAGGEELSFLAYYPYTGSDDVETFTAAGGVLEPAFDLDDDDVPQMTIAYTVPADATKHIDLMYAAKEPLAYDEPDPDGTVSLTFRHALARIQFEARVRDFGTEAVTIKSLKLRGAVLKGELTVSGADDTAFPSSGSDTYVKPVWDLSDDAADVGTIAVTTIPNQNLTAEMTPVIYRTDKKTPDASAGDLLVIPQSTLGLSLEVVVLLGTRELEPYIVPLSGSLDLQMNEITSYGLTITPHQVEMECIVYPWEKGGKGEYLFDGQHYLKIGGLDVFNSWAYASDPDDLVRQNLTIETDHPDGWKIDPASLSASWLTITGGDLFGGANKDNPATRSVNVATNHGPTDARTATFDIVAGNMRKTVTVKQRAGGFLAAPGVIGIGMESGELTIAGSREYAGTSVETNSIAGALAAETVYVTYFKWGSLVALGGMDDNLSRGGAFDASDIVSSPSEYKSLEALRDQVGDNYDAVPYVNMPGLDWVKAEYAQAFGDPCDYYFGQRNGTIPENPRWMLPAEEWFGSGGPFGTSASVANWTLTNGAMWVDNTNSARPEFQNLPVNGAVGGKGAGVQDWSMFLPLTSRRTTAGNMDFNSPTMGSYWGAQKASDIRTGGGLLFRSNQLNPSANSSYAMAHAIRCVKFMPKLDAGPDREFLAAGGTETITVTTSPSNMRWKVSSVSPNNSWLTVDTPTATGVVIRASVNDTFFDRPAVTIIFESLDYPGLRDTVIVRQQARSLSGSGFGGNSYNSNLAFGWDGLSNNDRMDKTIYCAADIDWIITFKNSNTYEGYFNIGQMAGRGTTYINFSAPNNPGREWKYANYNVSLYHNGVLILSANLYLGQGLP